MTSITLPFPPTLNNLFLNVRGRGRVASKAYKAWQNAAGWELRAQRPQPIKGRYRLTVTLTAPDRRARDADNYIKAPSDLLKAMGVIEDDSLAKSVTAEWSDDPPKKPGHVLLTLETA